MAKLLWGNLSLYSYPERAYEKQSKETLKVARKENRKVKLGFISSIIGC
jgi:hypothetical protein